VTELENWLQGISLGDRTGKLVTGYFSQEPNWKTAYSVLLLGTELEN